MMFPQRPTNPQIKSKLSSLRAASLIEYVVLIVIILSALYVMKDTIARGVFAKYRQTGESLSFGRQFDGKRTIVCRSDALSYNDDGTPNMTGYYDENCYYARVMRKPIIRPGSLTSVSGWDVIKGGCPTCDAGNALDAKACLACELAIKNQCAVESSYCSK